jgi:hypothetical protein
VAAEIGEDHLAHVEYAPKVGGCERRMKKRPSEGAPKEEQEYHLAARSAKAGQPQEGAPEYLRKTRLLHC